MTVYMEALVVLGGVTMGFAWGSLFIWLLVMAVAGVRSCHWGKVNVLTGDYSVDGSLNALAGGWAGALFSRTGLPRWGESRKSIEVQRSVKEWDETTRTKRQIDPHSRRRKAPSWLRLFEKMRVLFVPGHLDSLFRKVIVKVHGAVAGNGPGYLIQPFYGVPVGFWADSRDSQLTVGNKPGGLFAKGDGVFHRGSSLGKIPPHRRGAFLSRLQWRTWLFALQCGG